MLIGAEVPFVSTDYTASVLFMLLTGPRPLHTSPLLSVFRRFTYVSECFACMYVCTPCMCMVPRGSEESLRSPGPGVRDG